MKAFSSRWFRLGIAGTCAVAAAGASLASGYAARRATLPPYVVAAQKAVAAREAPQTKWLGPTSGPKCEAGKTIVYLNIGENNPIGHLWGVYLKNAAKVCGWKYVNLDGHSAPADWVKNASQAVALKPDAIVTSADAKTMHAPLSQAAKLGIPIVGLHATAKPGPDPADFLFTNIVSNPQDIGLAQLQWAIADSKGTARIIQLCDHIYSISMIKRAGWTQGLKTCPTCKLLKDDNFPMQDIPTRMGTDATSWVADFGPPIYVVTAADYYYDYAVPALRSANVATSTMKLAGADGTTQAYNRIRAGNQYQVLTVPEPIEMQSWQAVDEINRALHKLPASRFVNPVHLVVKANVDKAGSKHNQYFPQNNYKAHYTKIWKG
ncbi:MAG: substrate-binding domain-containing protein [Gaiellaceae bacterium]